RDLPSPRGLPIIGNVHQLTTSPHVKLSEWAKEFGDLFRIKMGCFDTLVVTGYDNIRTALVKHSVAFAGRPPYETSKLFSNGLSLAFNNYSPAWEKQKRCTVKALKLYTAGPDLQKRNAMEDTASYQANLLVDQLLASVNKDAITNPDEIVHHSATNVISNICFGRSFSKNDPELQKFVSINRAFDRAMGSAQIVNFWPFLKSVPVLGRSYQNLKAHMDVFWDFVFPNLKEHWKTYNPSNIRDIADCLWYQSHLPDNNDCDAIDLQRRIASAASDIFGAGYDTTHKVVLWSLFYMAAFPQYQQKIRDEVSRVVAPKGQITLRHHGDECPYVQAWIYEVLRHTSLAPILLPHYTTKEVTLNGVRIPAGVVVIFNAGQAHKDPKIWKNPDEFDPGHFLEEDGSKLRSEAVHKLLSWGAGKRRCPGAELSRHEIFVFVTTLVRRAYIGQAVDGVEPAFPWNTTGGISISPDPFRVKITERPS
uniref:Uncharacterized protein n=2 Tax=Ciona savignyi TaxID=51511 RepID=H2YGB8_CIOSA